MSRQNRVAPDGRIFADPGRGLFLGNRGCIHDDQGRIIRSHRNRAWITCLLSFKERRRALMQPGRWTELFFLDEAVALSAGHRPCAECRRADYNAFRAAWVAAGLPGVKAVEMDAVLHASRLTGSGVQQRFTATVRQLPDGACVEDSGQACLLRHGMVHPYAASGYRPGRPCPPGEISVLTPAPIVAVLRAGYWPVLHPSVG